MTKSYDEDRRLAEAEGTIRSLVRLAAIASATPTAVPIDTVFDSGREAAEWAKAWHQARAIAARPVA